MSEKELINHLLESTKQSMSKAEASIKLAKANIATIEEALASDKEKSDKEESDDFVEVLFGEELDDEIDNVVNEITSRLDKVYGSNKIVVNVKEVK